MLSIAWADFEGELAAELLRVFSPSADVRGHGHEERSFPAGKRDVSITAIEPAGRYAIQIHFDDGHDTGIYQWGYLRELLEDQLARWEEYESALRDAGKLRDADTMVINFPSN